MKQVVGNRVRNALRRLILSTVPPTITGKIASVDEGEFLCVVTPYDGEPDYHDVRLKVSVNDDDGGLVVIPDVDSEVTIAPLFNNEHAYYVVKFSKVKKWVLKTVSGRFIEITDDGKININGDDFGGLIKIEDLVEKLNNLEDLVNDLISKYNGHTHAIAGVTAGTGSVTSAVPSSLEMDTLTPTEVSDLENENVQHG